MSAPGAAVEGDRLEGETVPDAKHGRKFKPHFPPPSPAKGTAGDEGEDAPKVLLRVKRRREDAPVEALVVQGKAAKRSSIMSAMKSLSVGEEAGGVGDRASKVFRLLESVPAQDVEEGGGGGASQRPDDAAAALPSKKASSVGAGGVGGGGKRSAEARGNAKKADGERLGALTETASVKRRERALAAAKAARSSAVGSRRQGLEGAGGGGSVRVVDVDVTAKKAPAPTPTPPANGHRAEVFDECETPPKRSEGGRLEHVEGKAEVALNGVPMVRHVVGGGEEAEGEAMVGVEGEGEYVYDYYWVDPTESPGFDQGATCVDVDLPELWEDLDEDEWGSGGDGASIDSNDENNPDCDYPDEESDSDLDDDDDAMLVGGRRDGNFFPLGGDSGDDEDIYDNEFRFVGGGGKSSKADMNWYAYDSDEESD